MKLRFFLALWVGKLCYHVLRLFKRQASQQPGYLALAICPDFLKLAKKAKLCIAVTGTNGKTTVSNLITDALLYKGYRVVSNRAGANVDCGCATNLINSLNIFGNSRVDATVFEVDERYSRIILPAINPDYLLVTNLFRDSLKRNSNPDAIFEIIDTYCPSHTHLVLNADDLGSCFLKKDQSRTYFSVHPIPNENLYQSVIMDNSLCPVCHTKLDYSYRHYHHIGKTTCPNCEFKSPDGDVVVESLNQTKQTLTININNERFELPILSETIFNIYNEAAVVTILHQLGINNSEIKDIFNHISLPSSRLNKVSVNNISITQAMSKGQSSVSSCRTFDFVSTQPGDKMVIIAVDDAYDRKKSIEYWGWIYDVDYELLNQDNIKYVVALGPRYLDHQVRMLLAGIPKEKTLCFKEELQAIDLLDFTGIEHIFILYDTSTYKTSCLIKEQLMKRLEALK